MSLFQKNFGIKLSFTIWTQKIYCVPHTNTMKRDLLDALTLKMVLVLMNVKMNHKIKFPSKVRLFGDKERNQRILKLYKNEKQLLKLESKNT